MRVISSRLMDNKEEIEVIEDVESGAKDQMNVAPVVGADVEETEMKDPTQAELTPGDQDELGDDGTTASHEHPGVPTVR